MYQHISNNSNSLLFKLTRKVFHRNGLYNKPNINWTMYLINFILFTCLIQIVSSRDRSITNGIGPSYQTTYACEGQNLVILCAFNEKINLIQSNYGRFSIAICNENGESDLDVKCMSKRSFRVVFDTCNGKQNCSLIAKSNLFGDDPCPETEKYLEVRYQCVPIQTRRIKSKKINSSLNQAKTASNSFSLSTQATQQPIYPTNTMSLNGSLLSVSSFNDLVQNGVTKNYNHPASTLFSDYVTQWTPTDHKDLLNASKSNKANNRLNFNDNLLATFGEQLSNEDNQNNQSGELKFVDHLDQLYCSPTIIKEMKWNWTQVRKIVEQPCPEGFSGLVRWFCGVSQTGKVEWFPNNKPDFSECSSKLLKSMETRLSSNATLSNSFKMQRILSLDIALQMAIDLQQFTSSILHKEFPGHIYSSDLFRIARILNELIERVRQLIGHTREDDNQRKLEILNQFLMQNQNTVNDLLDPNVMDSWQDLQVNEQRTISSLLMFALQRNVHLLADNFNKPQDYVNSNANIYISMHLRSINSMDQYLDAKTVTSGVRLPQNSQQQSIAFSTHNQAHYNGNHLNQENSVHIPWQTLLEFANNGLVRFSLIIYKQLDQYVQLNSESLTIPTFLSSLNTSSHTMSSLSSTSMQTNTNSSLKYHINSDLVSLLMTSEPFVYLPGTLFITFKQKHITQKQQQLRCVQWNFKLKNWQFEGCRLIETNQTHSTCECNHLTVYALVKSAISLETNTSNPISNQTLDVISLQLAYNWLLYSNQLRLLVFASCILATVCFVFVLFSLTFSHYNWPNKINSIVSLNNQLQQQSLNYGYHEDYSLNKLNSDRNLLCIRQNLCLMFILIELLFAISSGEQRSDYEYRLNCAIFAALIHYLILIIFVWLAFDAYQLYFMVRQHLTRFTLCKPLQNTISTLSTITNSSNTMTNLNLNYSSAYDPASSSKSSLHLHRKWFYAIAYGGCSLLLLVSVLINPQSYGNSLSSGYCFLTNTGISYFWLLILPLVIILIFIIIFIIIIIHNLAKSRQKFNFQINKLNSSESNLTTNSLAKTQFKYNTKLCKKLKETVALVIIVCLTWSSALIYLNAAERFPLFEMYSSSSGPLSSNTANSQVNSQTVSINVYYHIFGVIFSALNIAQSVFFILYYCLLNNIVRYRYSLLANRTRQLFSCFIKKFNLNKHQKISSTASSANTIASTLSVKNNTLSTNGNTAASNISTILQQSLNTGKHVLEQPIVPPPTTMNNLNASKQLYFPYSNRDHGEKCSDYGFPSMINRSQVRNTTAFHSYQIGTTPGNTNSTANLTYPQIVEHVYECIDEDPYIAKLLLNGQAQQLHLQLGVHHRAHHLHHKTLLRPISSIVESNLQQQQHYHHHQQQQELANIYQQHVSSLNASCNQLHLRSLSDLSSRSDRPLLSQTLNNNILPAIIKDNTKSTIISNTLLHQHQNTPNLFNQTNQINQMNQTNQFNQMNTNSSCSNNNQQNLGCLNAQQLLKESTLI